MGNTKMRKNYGDSNPAEWVIDTFRRGLNTLISSARVKPEETPDALNINYTEDGLPTKRGGTELINTQLANTISGLASYYTDSGSRYLIAVAGGTAYYDNAGTWSMITAASGATFSTTSDCNFVQARNNMYFHDGLNMKCVNSSLVMTSLPGGVPAKFGIYWKGRQVVSGNASYPSRVFISRSADSSYFITTGTDTSAEWFDVQPSDGDKITGLTTFYNNLVVFKERSIHKAVPSDSTGDFISKVELINNSVGCVAHRSIDAVDNDVFFLSRKGVFVLGNEPNFFDTIRTNEVSARIHPEIDGITPTNFDKPAGIYHNYRYYLAYPFGGTTYNNKVMVYDTRYGAWSVHSGYNPNCFTDFIDTNGSENLYCGGDNQGDVLKMETGYSDNGTAINSYVKSPLVDLKAPDVTKFWMDMTAQMRNTQASVTIDVYVDGDLYKTATFNIGTTGGSGGLGTVAMGFDYLGLAGGATITSEVTTNVVKRFRINKRGRNVQVKVSNNNATDTWTLMSLRGTYRPLSHFVFTPTDKV